MGNVKTTTISQSTQQPTLVEATTQLPILLYNISATATIYLSDNQSFNTTDEGVVAIHPLASYILISDMYVSSAGVASVQIQTLPALAVGPAPVDIASSIIASGLATEIAALIATGSISGQPGGVPLLNQFTPLIFAGPSSLNGNAQVGIGGVSSNQPGTEGVIQLANNGAGTTNLCPIGVFIQWDDGSGNVTDVDGFWCYASSSTSVAATVIGFRTPTKALHCSVTILNTNGTPANSITYSVKIWQSSRIFNRFAAYEFGMYPAGALYTPFNFTTFPTTAPVQAPCDVFTGIAADIPSTSIASGITNQYLMPVLNGPAWVRGSSSSSAADMQLFITPTTDTYASGSEVINLKSDATGVIAGTSFIMPPVQCVLNIKNNNAAAKNLDCMIVVDRQI